MTKYIAVFNNQINITLTYKWNVISGFFIQFLQIITYLFVWRAIFKEGNTVGDYNLHEMTEYIIIAALLGVVFSSEHIFRLSRLVRTGTLTNILFRPYSYHLESLTVFIGKKVIEIIILTVFIGVFLSLQMFTLSIPSILGFILILVNFILLFLFGSLIGNLSFWIIQMWPMKPLYGSLMGILGGGLFPLDLLPDSIRSVVEVLPFSLFGYVNTKLLQGELNNGEIFYFLMVSLSWVVLFFFLYHLSWKIGLKKYESVNT